MDTVKHFNLELEFSPLCIFLGPDEKITTVSEAMQIQKIAKNDLLSRNEAVILKSFLTFSAVLAVL